MTAVPLKLLESMICKARYENANSQEHIMPEQFAYRPDFSTTLQLLEAQNDWALSINESKCVDIAYFDFRSAFERITHQKLIQILPEFGVRPRLVKWISSFLTNRTFRVKVNDALSSFKYAT